MKILIKNMVALGTKKFVLNEIKQLGLKLLSFESGELIFENELSLAETSTLEKRLGKFGLELIYNESVEDTVELEELVGTGQLVSDQFIS